jgi:hypothetical protein
MCELACECLAGTLLAEMCGLCHEALAVIGCLPGDAGCECRAWCILQQRSPIFLQLTAAPVPRLAAVEAAEGQQPGHCQDVCRCPWAGQGAAAEPRQPQAAASSTGSATQHYIGSSGPRAAVGAGKPAGWQGERHSAELPAQPSRVACACKAVYRALQLQDRIYWTHTPAMTQCNCLHRCTMDSTCNCAMLTPGRPPPAGQQRLPHRTSFSWRWPLYSESGNCCQPALSAGHEDGPQQGCAKATHLTGELAVCYLSVHHQYVCPDLHYPSQVPMRCHTICHPQSPAEAKAATAALTSSQHAPVV